MQRVFLYKLSTGHSNQYKRICGLDVRPPHKNIIILVAGEVKKSVRSGSTVVGCDSSGRERCTVLQGHNEDIRDVRKVISGIKPPILGGELCSNRTEAEDHIYPSIGS